MAVKVEIFWLSTRSLEWLSMLKRENGFLLQKIVYCMEKGFLKGLGRLKYPVGYCDVIYL